MSYKTTIHWFKTWAVLAALLLAACSPALDQPTAEAPAPEIPDTPVPLPTETETPQATATDIAPATQTPVPVTPEEGAEPGDAGEETNGPDRATRSVFALRRFA
jgi:hypothetical protein